MYTASVSVRVYCVCLNIALHWRSILRERVAWSNTGHLFNEPELYQSSIKHLPRNYMISYQVGLGLDACFDIYLGLSLFIGILHA